MEDKIIATNANIQLLVSNEILHRGNSADLNNIDVSRVTNMSGLFRESAFNGDISRWDVSHVTNMSDMFSVSMFNGDISNWDVSNVTDMSRMFKISVFNHDISKWDVSHVTDMHQMFGGSAFNGDISKWDVSHVTSMFEMFSDAQFNQDISGWDVSRVANMQGMFEDNAHFNHDISGWNVRRLEYCDDMFRRSGYNGNLFKWKKEYHIPKNLKYGYKKILVSYMGIVKYAIAKIEIPEDATVVHGCTSRSKKMRTNKCKVLAFYSPNLSFGIKPFGFRHKLVTDVDDAFSYFRNNFKYRVGQTINIKDFNDSKYVECGSGIHFFEKFSDAVAYQF